MAKTALELGPEGWKKYLGKTKPRPKLTQRKRVAARARNQTPRAAVARKPSDGTIHAAKTALELGPDGWKEYFPQRRRPRRWPKRLRLRAMNVVRQAARILREQFGAKRVVVFGSLAHQLWYSPLSDIDLAVWGIDPQDFLEAFGVVERIASGFDVNLVDPQKCFPSIRTSIKKEGIEV
ncbi:MAG: nucleotidyltransferase domain-containing protein [Chloroflexi bacterium]|nr:nucleotidyltransferase domain-containing protein [Chloroflexota bacterium]